MNTILQVGRKSLLLFGVENGIGGVIRCDDWIFVILKDRFGVSYHSSLVLRSCTSFRSSC